MADTEAGLDLWRIAELTHGDKETESVVLSDLDWQGVRNRLSGKEQGRSFLAAWDRFMTEHGHHCRGELEFYNARWSERPDYVLDWLRSSLHSIGTVDPLARHHQLAIERDALTGQCLQRLRNPIKRCLFAWSLRRVQRLAVERENWKNEVIRQLTALRQVLLVLGARFQKEGLLSNADDVFFLEMTEIKAIAKGRVDPDMGQRVLERRTEYESNKACTPPPVVAGRFDPNTYVGPQIEAGVKELKGIAVSPGSMRSTGERPRLLTGKGQVEVWLGQAAGNVRLNILPRVAKEVAVGLCQTLRGDGFRIGVR
jgi:pyruvate,water dikinase